MSEFNETQPKSSKGLKIAVVAEAIIIIALLFMLNHQKTETKTITEEKVVSEKSLQGELNSLMAEHNEIKAEYGDLTSQMTEKDSLINAKSLEIQKLIAKNADYNKIKKELFALRTLRDTYEDQIDSLFTVNQQLKSDLKVVTKNYQDEQEKSSSLMKDKDDLTRTVELGSALRAFNVEGMGINLRGKNNRELETFKASRVDRIKICFTIGQNAIAKAGTRTVYVRVSRPDRVVVTPGKGDEYSFDAKGVKLQYTVKKDFDYANKSVNMCLNWEKMNDQDAMKGTYNVSIYLDGEEIGQSTFQLL